MDEPVEKYKGSALPVAPAQTRHCPYWRIHIPAGPAITNAIANAVGVRVMSLPVDQEALRGR